MCHISKSVNRIKIQVVLNAYINELNIKINLIKLGPTSSELSELIFKWADGALSERTYVIEGFVNTNFCWFSILKIDQIRISPLTENLKHVGPGKIINFDFITRIIVNNPSFLRPTENNLLVFFSIFVVKMVIIY